VAGLTGQMTVTISFTNTHEMKKLHTWLGTAVCLLATAGLQAQPDNYYHLNGTHDHGTANEVVKNLAGNGYVTVGTAYTVSPANSPIVVLSNYSNAGALIWSRTYPITTGMAGPSNFTVGTSVAPSPALGRYGVLGFTNFTTPQQSVLIQTNAVGAVVAWTPLGNTQALSVIWDATNNQWAVLSYAAINGGDLMLTTVSPAGAILTSNTYDSGPGNPDRPARMMQDPQTGNYVLVGTSFTGTDLDVFVVRTNPFGALLCAETFGNPGIDEVAVDVTFGRHPNIGPSDVVLGYIPGPNNTPFVLELDAMACPMYINCTRLVANVPNNIPTAITFMFSAAGSVNYAICGRQSNPGNDNGFVMVIDQLMAPVIYARYGQPAQPGNEDLTDVLWDNLTLRLVFTGEHQRTVPWLGSPAGQFYPWLLMTNQNGIGMCPDVPGMVVGPNPMPQIFQFFPMPFSAPSPVNVSAVNLGQTLLGECANPFRLAPEEAMATVALFPNPAASQLSVTYAAPGTDAVTFELLNMLGETVMTRQLPVDAERAEINVAELPSGIYIYRMRSADIEMACDKLVIQH
jgi:hypothetical protein